MYTLSLLLLALFSLYIGIFAFWRWDASWLRELDAVPVQASVRPGLRPVSMRGPSSDPASAGPAFRKESEENGSSVHHSAGGGTASPSGD